MEKMYTIICFLVPMDRKLKTTIYVKADSIKEALNIIRRDHNIFEENVLKIKVTPKKSRIKSTFDWTINEISELN
jgi:hypothetical protein